MREGTSLSPKETALSSGMGLNVDKELLAALYDNQHWTVDLLPHTLEEEALVNAYNAIKGSNYSKRQIFVTLTNMRKQSLLKPKRRR